MRKETYWIVLITWVLLIQQGSSDLDRCTAIAVGPKASSNGASMTTHTNDCSSCDFRLSKVPPKSYPSGSVYEVPLARFNYPRYVGDARGSTYRLSNVDREIYNWTETKGIGSIPQVRSTFGYIDGAYGIINEMQLSIGESTCGGRLVSKPISSGGKALFDISALSRLALERTSNSRDAIQLMGDLAVKYGYYGAEWEGEGAYGEAGEALTVVDPNEAWVFHIHPDDTGASAVWVAQRVPDDEIAVVANQFIIHKINLSDQDNFMGSSNVLEVAIRQEFWNPEEGEFDFTKAYAMERIHPSHYYSTRRQWRVFTLANPNLELSPYTDTFATDYPFSVQPEKPLDAKDIMKMMRDHYEGTQFDMTKGPAGGPYGNPDRYDPSSNGDMSDEVARSGNFERAISIFRASYSWVSQTSTRQESKLIDKIWFGMYAPHATTYVPLYVHIDEMPMEYRIGSLYKYDPKSAFWTHCAVGNWVSHFYIHAIPYVQVLQKMLEYDSLQEQADVKKKATTLAKFEDISIAREYLTQHTAYQVQTAHHEFSKLFYFLIAKFHDGYIMRGMDAENIQPKSLFYPYWWLKEVGYFDALTSVMNTNLSNVIPGPRVTAVVVAATCFASLFTFLGLQFGKRYYGHRRHNYSRIY